MIRGSLWPILAVITALQAVYHVTRHVMTAVPEEADPWRSSIVDSVPPTPLWAVQWTCPSPKFVYFESEYMAFILSPLVLVPDARHYFAQAVCLLYIAVIESRLSRHRLPRLFWLLSLLFLSVALALIRFGVGYGFSRGFGWSRPWLFFSSAAHECGAGLLPLVIAAVIAWDALLRGDKYQFSVGRFRVRLTPASLHVLILAPLVVLLGAAWWSVAGVLTGVAALPTFYAAAHAPSSRKPALPRAEPPPPGPLRASLAALRTAALLAAIVAAAAAARHVMQREPPPTSAQIMSLAGARTAAVTFIVMTAPRRKNPDHLYDTLVSFLDEFPAKGDALNGMFRVVVFTSFEEAEYAQFETTRARIERRYPRMPAAVVSVQPGEGVGREDAVKSDTVIVWARVPPAERRSSTVHQQRLDFATAITTTVREKGHFMVC